VKLEFAGAAREVTGSCHLLRVNGSTIALDCGLFQGRRQETDEKNRRLPCPISELDAVVLSHAHIDHSGRLPLLAREGYAKTIWATPATHDLSAIMLADSAHIQEKDAEFLTRRGKSVLPPLYTMRDAVRVPELMVSVPYRKMFDVVPGVRAMFVDAGHILGSASVVLDCTEGSMMKRLVYSADIGRVGLPIIRDPEPPIGADTVVMESTYGNRRHESVSGARDKLARVVNETVARGGRVLVPAFAVGRTQEIIYELHQLYRSGEIPGIPIYIDSPLAIDATGIFASHPDVFDSREHMVQSVAELFDFPLVHYTRTVEESKALMNLRGPLIIVAASGMAESGRILHHLAQGAPDQRNTVLIVGFQAEHTLGRRIVERQPRLRIFGEEVPLRARVEIINGYSAHADQRELVQWLDAVRASSSRLGQIFLVHGEAEAQSELTDILRDKGYFGVASPAYRSVVTI
jgi:metallo-beta-lactamase family protein